jgi:hypothetical protein
MMRLYSAVVLLMLFGQDMFAQRKVTPISNAEAMLPPGTLWSGFGVRRDVEWVMGDRPTKVVRTEETSWYNEYRTADSSRKRIIGWAAASGFVLGATVGGLVMYDRARRCDGCMLAPQIIAATALGSGLLGGLVAGSIAAVLTR